MYRYILAFAIALGGAQFISEPAQAQNAVKCESRKFKYRECDTDMRRPRITRQLSRSPALRAILGDFSGVRSGWTGVAVQFSRILAGHAGASGIGAGTTVTHRAQTTNTIPGAGVVMALNWN